MAKKRKLKDRPKPRSNRGVTVNCTILRVMYQERGFTQQSLAEAVGVSLRTVQHWLWAERRPQKKYFNRLCAVLQCAPNELEITTQELTERGRHARIARFYQREHWGKNEPPEYKEVQRIEADLQDAATRDAAEDEVKAGTITVFGAQESHPAPEPDAPSGDDEPTT